MPIVNADNPVRKPKAVPPAPPKAAPASRFSVAMLPKGTLHRIVAALPIILVNCVAVSGQLAWAHDHLASWGLPGQLVFSAALESIALSFGYHAYLAEKSNDAAFGMKLSSYLSGGIVGAINYQHFSHDWSPTGVAIVVGGMSALSPHLWSMFARRVSRSSLLANRLIDQHSVRLGATRYLWHPVRSAKVMYAATWSGEHSVTRAIDTYNRSAAERTAAKAAAKSARALDGELKKLSA